MLIDELTVHFINRVGGVYVNLHKLSYVFVLLEEIECLFEIHADYFFSIETVSAYAEHTFTKPQKFSLLWFSHVIITGVMHEVMIVLVIYIKIRIIISKVYGFNLAIIINKSCYIACILEIQLNVSRN
jgi:hypothetical protein